MEDKIEATGKNLRVEIEFERQELVDTMAERIFALFNDRHRDGETVLAEVRTKVSQMLDQSIREAVTAITTKAVEDTIGTMLRDGWETTDRWGDKQPKVTIMSLVRPFLEQKGDSYNKSPLQKLTEEAISAALKTGLEKDIEDLRAKVKQHLTALVDGGIRKAFTEAIGIKA